MNNKKRFFKLFSEMYFCADKQKIIDSYLININDEFNLELDFCSNLKCNSLYAFRVRTKYRDYGCLKSENKIELDNDQIKILTDEVGVLSTLLEKLENRNPGSENAIGGSESLLRDLYTEIKYRIEDEEKNNIFSDVTKEALVFSDKGYCIDSNKRASHLFGYSAEEFIGMFGTEVIAEESKDKVKKNMLSGYEKPYEVLAQRKDGSKFWAEIEGRMYFYRGKNIRVTAVRDITERKKILDELEKSEENYRSIFENSVMGIFRSTPEGKYEIVNQTFADILGYNYPEDMIMSVNDISKLYCYPEDREKIKKRFEKDGFVKDFEVQANHTSGRKIWLSVNASANLNNDGNVYYEGSIQDITSKKLAVQELKKSQALLKEAERISKTGAWELDVKTGTYIFSDEWMRIHGVKNKTMKKEQLFKVAHPDDINKIESAFEKSLSGKEGYDIEHRIINQKTKKVKYVKAHADIIRDNKGKVIKMFGTAQDITDKKKIEMSLLENETRLRESQKIGKIASYTLYLNTGEVYFSEELYNILELKIKLLSLEDFYKYVHKDDLDILIKTINASEKNKTNYDFEYRVIVKKKIKYIRSIGGPISDDGGKVIRISGILQDITEKKEMEKSILDLNSSLMTAQKIANLGYWEYDVKSTMSIWSPEVFKMFGMPLSSKELKFNEQKRVVHGKDWEKYNAAIQKLITENVPYDIQIRLIHSNKRSVWIRTIGYSRKNEKGEVYELYGTCLDITEMKKTEEALRESEEKFRTIIENISEGIVIDELIYNKSGNVVNWYIREVNPAFEKLTGYKKKNIINKKASEIYLNNEPYAEYFKLFKEIDKKRKTLSFEHINKSNNKIFLVSLFPHKPGYVAYKLMDITDIKKSENELLVNLTKYKTLFESMPAGITITDSKGKIIESNNEAVKILEMSKRKQNRRSIDSIEWNTVRKNETRMPSSEFASVAALKKNKKVANQLMGIVKGKNRITWLNVTAVPIPLKDHGVLVNYFDITDRVNAERALAESEERYKMLIESAPDAIAIHSKSKLVYANKSAVSLLKAKSIKNLLGTNIKNIVHKDCHAEVKARVNTIINEGAVIKSVEEKYVTFDGKEIPVEVTASPIIFKNNKSVQVIVRDISERKKAEKKILEERNRAENYLEIAEVMMLVLDTEGKIEMINSKGAEILEYTKKYIIGRNWFDNFIPDNQKLEIKNLFKKSIKNEELFAHYYENKVKCRNNVIKILAWHNNFIRDDKGKIISVLCSGQDITENYKMKLELEKSYNNSIALTRHIQGVRETERASLARDIHDDLGQSLTALKFDITRIKRSHESMNYTGVEEKIDSALQLTNNLIKTVQELTSELRPGLIDDLGLIPTIEWYSEQFEQRSNIKVKLSLMVKENDLNENEKINIYRIFQESLTNIARHAKANLVSIKFYKNNASIILIIKDNGIGISNVKKNLSTSYGLIGMKERASYINGDIKIINNKNKGTAVKLTIYNK